MNKVILLRYGEIHLKGHNRGFFERVLLDNIRKKLKGISCEVSRTSGRYLVSNFSPADQDLIIQKMQQTFGLVSLSVASEIPTEQEIIKQTILDYFKRLNDSGKLDGKSFKVSVKRADKTFPIKSTDYEAQLGGDVLEIYPDLKVNLKVPDIEVIVDIRESKKTYILTEKIACVGGMPVGTSEQGLLMLSGGIDSPVAGYMMAKRGMKINAIHFHSFPYTSIQAKEKVLELAKILTTYCGEIRLFLVPFTEIQEQIHANCDASYMITIMRRIMLRIAEQICENNAIKAIVTGESLGQVASQTIQSITVTNSVLKEVPLLRPVIGFDKTEIIEISKKIGTFDTSILPYEDCCTVFLPENPVIKPTIKNAEYQEKSLDVDLLVQQAVDNTEIIKIVE